MKTVLIWIGIIGALMPFFVIWNESRKAVNRELEAEVRRERERAAEAARIELEMEEQAERERIALAQRRAQELERFQRSYLEGRERLEREKAAPPPSPPPPPGRYRRGYVYILRADECEFKIGFTTRSPSGRAKAFGLPLVAIADAVDPKASEAAAHAALAQWRKGNYELFKVSLDQAVAAVANATGSRVTLY